MRTGLPSAIGAQLYLCPAAAVASRRLLLYSLNLCVDSPGCNNNSAELQILIVKLMMPGSLGSVLFAFQLCLFVAKPGHTRASAERRTLICEAAYGRELGLFCFCFPSLFLC
jgi:hypothetical protein